MRCAMLTVNEIPWTIFHSSVLHDHYSKWVVIFIHDVAMNERKEPTSRQPEIDRFFFQWTEGNGGGKAACQQRPANMASEYRKMHFRESTCNFKIFWGGGIPPDPPQKFRPCEPSAMCLYVTAEIFEVMPASKLNDCPALRPFSQLFALYCGLNPCKQTARIGCQTVVIEISSSLR